MHVRFVVDDLKLSCANKFHMSTKLFTFPNWENFWSYQNISQTFCSSETNNWNLLKYILVFRPDQGVEMTWYILNKKTLGDK